jgi:hypothetical protein
MPHYRKHSSTNALDDGLRTSFIASIETNDICRLLDSCNFHHINKLTDLAGSYHVALHLHLRASQDLHCPAKQPRTESRYQMVMKIVNARFWIGLAALIIAILCILAFSLDTPKVDAGTPVPAVEPAKPNAAVDSQTYEGIITDAHCGAKHSAAVGLSAADCTRACVHSGEHFALVDGDKAYALEGDQAALKRVAGERVKIMGTLTGSVISVASVASPTP